MDKIFSQIAAHLGLVGLWLFAALIAILTTLRELARIRLDISRQRSTDLLNRRFAAYQRLWLLMQPLAVYTEKTFSADTARSTSKNLTEWYFSENGGLFLSESARDFYFALQDTLKKFAEAPRLQNTPHLDGRDTFINMLEFHPALSFKYKKCVDCYLAEHPERMPPEDWKHLCKALRTYVIEQLAKDPAHGSYLAFCMTQQVSSALRSRLAHELDSRLDTAPKWWRLW
jgi:hypothetical protein